MISFADFKLDFFARETKIVSEKSQNCGELCIPLCFQNDNTKGDQSPASHFVGDNIHFGFTAGSMAC